MFKIICKYVVIFSILLWLLPPQMASAAGTIPKGGMFADIAVDGLTYKEARDKVQKEVGIWLQGEPIQAESPDGIISIPRDSFLFDIDRTFNEFKEQTKRPWYLFFLKPKSAQIPLIVQIYQNPDIKWPDYADSEATLEKAKEEASHLSDQPFSIVYKEESELKKGTVAEVAFEIPDISIVEIEQMADLINGLTIDPETQFSLIETVLEELRPTASQEGADFFATALYALFLKTNVYIVERHSQGSIPSYSEAGIEAAADPSANKDFIIYNPNFHSYTISAQLKDNKLHILLSSVLREVAYDYLVENKNEMKPRTLYRFSYKLAPGSRVPMESGKKGMQVEVYRVSSVNGSVQEKELISRDFYPPTPTVFLVSSQEPPEVIEELTVETEDSSEDMENPNFTGETEVSISSADKEEILNIINKAACEQLDNVTKQKACQQILRDSGLSEDVRNDKEINTTNETTVEDAKG